MPRTIYYEENTRWLDAALYQKIKYGIEQYLLLKKLGKKKLQFGKGDTFFPLIDEIEDKFKPLKVNPTWLIELYAGRKTNHNVQKDKLEAVCKVIKVDSADDSTYIKLILNFKALCVTDDAVKDFAGKYKLFFGGRYQPSIYSIAYDIPMEIFENGIVKIDFDYIGQVFWGLAMVRDINTLEIISFDFVDEKIKGVGRFCMFKINGYRKKQHYFPGVNYSFDSASMPVVYQAFLSANPDMTREDPIVIKYFGEIVNNLRMECPNLSETEELKALFS